MSVLIQDTARNNLTSWTVNAVSGGYARGAVLSPFSSPVEGNGYKRAAHDISRGIRDAEGEFWFDSMTYALDMPRAGDFRHYDGWELWGNTRGALEAPSDREEHIRRVFEKQASLEAVRLSPSVLVSYPDTPKSQLALEISQSAYDLQPDAWATIAGDQTFWSSGAELDAHVGALNQLEPRGWLLVVARADNAMPPSATREEVFGLMRTTFALSQDRPVRVAFGDLAGLPAIAAGAESVGTGWDIRQRICAYQDFEQRAADKSTGGQWYQRPTLQGLLGSLSGGEYEVLVSERSNLASRLTPDSIGPKPEQAFEHHTRVLTKIIEGMGTLSGRARVENLRTLYSNALVEWPEVQRITGAKIGPSRWITPFLEGVDLFAASEGWV